MPSTLLLPVLNWARKLRFPVLFKITAALFAVTIFIPDPIPFLDELLLGMGTINENPLSIGGIVVSLIGAIILLAIVNLVRRGSVR